MNRLRDAVSLPRSHRWGDVVGWQKAARGRGAMEADGAAPGRAGGEREPAFAKDGPAAIVEVNLGETSRRAQIHREGRIECRRFLIICTLTRMALK